ncbi:MAG: hypothetical protein K8F52_05445 [Candidatus Scalindua rubra]|uniref:Uncharacterized protein n=1 Tax=Candidatus Scalindua brodae TaxID=237368 RepID=A0A0B0EM21_9BACT|nr:MAG: hypothetical protein SCABRO_00583 [Candidatus Scalindua brodae]MBZ0108091.1 hypothetical protein [Candidatus Scalindua rubra]
MKIERVLKIVLLALAVLDLVLGTIFVFFGEYLFTALHLQDYAHPLFFMICVGLFLYQYTFIQFIAYKDPRKYSTCLNLTVIIRLTFPIVYISAIFLWGLPFTLLHVLFALSAFADLAFAAFILISMRKLGILFLQGDETADNPKEPACLLRTFLLVLTIAEFIMGSSWMIFPAFWLKLCGITYIVDPFWTRATGLFLVNIAYIQFLGFLNVNKYRMAVIISGLYRALWPLLYWYQIAFGEGNTLFKGFILFFSFFNIFSCITILRLVKKATGKPIFYVPENK